MKATPTQQIRRRDSGFALVAVFIVLIPMLVLVGAATNEINNRSGEIRVELDQELALLSAESGIDDAIYRGRIGELKDGDVYERELGGGQSFETTAKYLKTDGQDNDGDGQIDEDDEDVFQVIVTGTYRRTTRRLAAYLGPVPLLPKMEAALVTQDPKIQIDLKGSPLISGLDMRMDGSPGTAPDVPGLAITPPGTAATLSAQLTGTEPTKVVGAGGVPSIDTAAMIDIATLVDQARNIAHEVLTTDKYTTHTFGDASAGHAQVTFREGNVTFAGNSRGAGVLVVTGNLTMTGTFRFDGVIIVLGKITNSAGTARVYGSILQGPNGGSVTVKGTADILYSAEAISLANNASGTYVAFNGWQEIARE